MLIVYLMYGELKELQLSTTGTVMAVVSVLFVAQKVTFSADIVTGREEHRPQPQHQLTQEPCFRVLKDLHTFERV